MRGILFAVLFLTAGSVVWAEEPDFSVHLFPKFQVKACTECHDFFETRLQGRSFGDHKGRKPKSCVYCHKSSVTGFEHPEEWFARPGLYTSDMNAQETCESVKKALHAEFKSETLLARNIEEHLFKDARVLWAIEGATPNSGKLPKNKKREKETDLVKGGLAEWKAQVQAWISGGMKCP